MKLLLLSKKNESPFINEVVDEDDIDDDDDKYMNSSGDISFTTPNVPREVYCQKHNHIFVSNNIGPATIYIVNEDDKKTIIPVFFLEYYEYRGKDVRMLNRLEYYCLVQIKEKRRQ